MKRGNAMFEAKVRGQTVVKMPVWMLYKQTVLAGVSAGFYPDAELFVDGIKQEVPNWEEKNASPIV